MIHRHLDVPPDTPVEELPLAAIHDLLDRGDLDDWRPLLRQIERHPDGELAGAVARLVDAYPMYGTYPDPAEAAPRPGGAGGLAATPLF